jgi:PAS domain S-box-containing protein
MKIMSMQSLFQENHEFDFASLLSHMEDNKLGTTLSEVILNDMDKDSELVPIHIEDCDQKLSNHLEKISSNGNFIKNLQQQQFGPRRSNKPMNSPSTMITDESLTSIDFIRGQTSMTNLNMDFDEKMAKSQMKLADAQRKKCRKPEKSIQEKLQSKRERNRQHAKNTRVRKKAYIETLKTTVDSYLKTKAVQDAELKLQAEHHAQVKLSRYKTLCCFMNYRVLGYVEPFKWNTILEPGFTCILPVTPYRSCPKVEIFSNRRVIVGVSGMQAESQSIQLFLECIGKGSPKWQQTFALPKHERLKWSPKFICDVPYESFITQDNHTAVAKWRIRTINAVVNGAASEIEIQGMSYCSFSNFNKLVNFELSFDVLGTIQSLKDALGPRLMSSIPNTLEKAKKENREAIVITESKSPYNIIFVNSKWVEMCGFTEDETIGQSLSIIQGPLTEKDELLGLMRMVEQKQPCSAVVHNYQKSGKIFLNYFRVYPISSSDSSLIYFLGYMEIVPDSSQLIYGNTASPPQLFPSYSVPATQTHLSGYSSPDKSCGVPI